MKYYKKYEYGMWHVHAFDDDVPEEVVLELAGKLDPITETEANDIRRQPPSAEYQQRIEAGSKALGGRNAARWPPKEYKEAIGHICVNAAHLEVTIRTIIWTVAGVDVETGMAFTEKLDRNGLMKTLERLIDTRVPSLSIVLRAINKELDSLYLRRNKFVHKTWNVTAEGKPGVTDFFIKKDSSITEVRLDEMYDVAEGFIRIESMLFAQIALPLMQS